jgi:predicted KAP-like P-loop ATPase
MPNGTPEQYTDDAPITTRDADRFGRWPFAERVANVIATRTEPASIVVGIYGPWGDGKTSVLNMMSQTLASHSNVVIVPFNPWNFESEAQLIRAFFDTLSDAIGKTLSTKAEELGKFLGKYGGVLSMASLPFGLDAGATAMAAGDKLSNVELDELKERVGKILVEAGKRVVVFIDDLDRLDRGEIHAILKLIKLSASFQNTAYVLAFDDEMVAASLGERYGAGDVAAGRNFIEKIIQVPLHLPDAEAVDLRQLTFEGVDEVLSTNSVTVSEDEAEAFALHFQEGILPSLHTPRQVKRYLNAIRFAVPLLKGEVHVVDQLLLEALRTVYPELYLSMRANEDVYTGHSFSKGYGDGTKQKEAAKATIEIGLKGLTTESRAAAVHLLKALFPRLEGIFGNTNYGADFESTWARGRRIASTDYFRRYFQYAVPRRDIADNDVDAFIRAANGGDEGKTNDFLVAVTDRQAWSRALDKLFARRPELNELGARTAAIALASISEKIPYERGMFADIMAARNRAASLAVAMIQSISDQKNRIDLAGHVVDVATALSFGTECLRWLGYAREAWSVSAACRRRRRLDRHRSPDKTSFRSSLAA